MGTEGRITDSQTAELLPWRPESSLVDLVLNEVRYSRGYLRADLRKWYAGLAAHWMPLFHALGVEVRVVSLRVGLDFPEALTRVVPVELDGEWGVLGIDKESQDTIIEMISQQTSTAARTIVQEYIERRFISTLSMSWSGATPLLCYYAPPEAEEGVEILGSICLTLELGGNPCSFWVGMGPKVLNRLDLSWREHVVALSAQESEQEKDEDTWDISVLITELAVPPAMLIDYMRSGTVVDLEVPISEDVLVNVNGKVFAEGKLRQFNGRFAVEITNLQPAKRSFPENTTRVQVEIASAQIDTSGLAEHSQLGAVLLTRTPLGSTASMVISGENIAPAVIGQIDDHFALNVLPK